MTLEELHTKISATLPIDRKAKVIAQPDGSVHVVIHQPINHGRSVRWHPLWDGKFIGANEEQVLAKYIAGEREPSLNPEQRLERLRAVLRCTN
jgi:hypothetical protein